MPSRLASNLPVSFFLKRAIILANCSNSSLDTLYKEERESSNKWKGNIGIND